MTLSGGWVACTDAVRVLSEEPENQIASIGAGHPDELGLGFEDGYLLVPTLVAEGVAFSRQSLSLLSQIADAARSGRDAT